MAQVVGSVEQVTVVIDEFARASAEQSAGVEEIGRAIAQVDTATQQNAALVEESASAAESFQREAARLLEVVDRFKTDRSEARGSVVALVKAAAAHLRKQGAEQACRDFCDPRGRFVHGEHYVVALDLQCNVLAFAPNPQRVGQNDHDAQDADGRFFSRNVVEMAQASGSGWCDYRMLNPRTGRVEPKSMYFEKVGDLVLGCGIYRTDEAAPSGSSRAVVPRAAWA
jgi:signal transduction histidine kinase